MTDAQRMQELLFYANLSKVAKALNVSKAATSNWARGLDVNPLRLRQVEDLLRPQSASEVPTTNAELLKEMRAIRQLLTRQSRAAAPPPDFVSLVVDALRDDLRSAVVDRPARGSRTPARGAAGRRKAAARTGADR